MEAMETFELPAENAIAVTEKRCYTVEDLQIICLLYTSPSPRDLSTSRMPSSA